MRLPRAAECERAATPGSGEYPWGEEEPDAERANFALNIGSPTPVGVYPLGAGPFGHCDLAGNVWEWCMDKEEAWEGGRVLRGGGWRYPAENLRAAFRLGARAPARDVGIGFRVLAAPAST